MQASANRFTSHEPSVSLSVTEVEDIEGQGRLGADVLNWSPFHLPSAQQSVFLTVLFCTALTVFTRTQRNYAWCSDSEESSGTGSKDSGRAIVSAGGGDLAQDIPVNLEATVTPAMSGSIFHVLDPSFI